MITVIHLFLGVYLLYFSGIFFASRNRGWMIRYIGMRCQSKIGKYLT